MAGRSLTIGASIGIAADRSATLGVDDLLSDADLAMYQAKALGNGHYKVFVATDPAADGPGGKPAVHRPRRSVRAPKSAPSTQAV